MGSYETIVKIEEMRRRVEDGDPQSALKILDTIATRKIKNMSDLNLIAEVYAENGRYEEAAQLYHKIYEKTKTRKSLYQLVDLSIRMNNIEDAQYYLVEYQKAAPKDFYKYVFRYKIEKLKAAPYEKLIEILEALKDEEYMEKWAYELAKTYYKAGLEKECVKECSDIILWFGEGPYVEKAKILKSYFSGETDKEKILEGLKKKGSGDREKATEKAVWSKKREEPEEPEQKGAFHGNAADKSEASYIEAAGDITGKKTKDGTRGPAQEEYQDERIEKHQGEGQEEYQDEDREAYRNGSQEEYQSEGREKYRNGSREEHQDEDWEEPREKGREEYQGADQEDPQEYDRRLDAIAGEVGLKPEEIFGSFLRDYRVRKQLVESLEAILREAGDNSPVMMVIAGAKGSGKTTLAKGITAFLYEAGILKSPRIAKIDAQKLNTIDIRSKENTLRDCCLVIEHAGELLAVAIDSLFELCDSIHGAIAVIFEDAPENLEKLFADYPGLLDLFQNRIDLT